MPSPIIETTRDGVRAAVAALRKEGGKIALVPTMGALHQGHLALVAEAARHADHVVVSIFVNPTQFAPHEDFDRYPRQLEADVALLADAGVSLVYAPDRQQIYPPGDSTRVSVAGVSEHFEGVFRPHFFTGVATVVARLFVHVAPDMALFGQKDFQQLAVIARMTDDLGLPVKVLGVPTVREADGLALSSRNAYLSPEERDAAVALPDAMKTMARAIARGGEVAKAEAEARARLAAAGFGPIDYCSLADAGTLQPVTSGIIPPERLGSLRLLFAALLGRTRLIDNCGLADPA
jgi:pantoate--beta-alanine ligase